MKNLSVWRKRVKGEKTDKTKANEEFIRTALLEQEEKTDKTARNEEFIRMVSVLQK